MCVYRCVYSTSAVSLPVHNWCCAGNLHICKLPVYSQTSSHKHSKSTNRPDSALAEKRQDKQHPTSKLGSLFFFVSTSSSFNLPSHVCLFFPFMLPLLFCSFYFPSLPLHFIPFMSLSSPIVFPALCSPLYPSPVHHSQQFLSLVTPFLFFLPECSYPIFITKPLRASNLVETLSEITAYLCRHTTMKDRRKYWRVINITWGQSKFIFLFNPNISWPLDQTIDQRHIFEVKSVSQSFWKM